MEHNPQISVIIPSFNSENFIKSCLESVLCQRGVVTEIIVVDDKGNDGTRDIIANLQKTNPNINLITREQPLGQATARNIGIDNARGDYIVFLDSDDAFLNKNALLDWYEDTLKSDSDICVCQFQAKTKTVRNGRIVPNTNQNVTIENFPELANVTSCWQLMLKNSFVLENKIYFSKRLKQREDRLFVNLAFSFSKNIFVSKHTAIMHRIHQNSSFHRIDLNELEMYNIHLEEFKIIFDSADKLYQKASSFYDSNLILILIMTMTYWRSLLFDNFETKEVQRFFSILGSLPRNGVLYPSKVLALPQNSDRLLKEGDIDLIFHTLTQRKLDLTAKLLTHERLDFFELYSLVQSTKSALSENIATRYLSFSRNHKSLWLSSDKQPNSSHKFKKLILHVGMTKTGSSSLQNTLEENRFNLMECGYYYPVLGTNRERDIRRERINGHANLLQRFLDQDDRFLSSFLNELSSVNERCDILILSSENLSDERFFQIVDLEKFLNWLKIDTVEIILFLRQPDEWFFSYYKDKIANLNNDFAEKPDEFLERLLNRNLIDYLYMETHFSRFGKCTVLNYEKILQDGGTSSWLSNYLGLKNIRSFKKNQTINSSFSDEKAINVYFLKKLGLKQNDLIKLSNAIRNIPESKTEQFLFSENQIIKIQQLLEKQRELYRFKYKIEPNCHYYQAVSDGNIKEYTASVDTFDEIAKVLTMRTRKKSLKHLVRHYVSKIIRKIRGYLKFTG